MCIRAAFSLHGIDLSSREESLFSRFLEIFLEKNSHINLSAIRDTEGIVLKHFVDSLSLTRFATLHGQVLDIGTGGGFPWLPLAIRFPETDFVLLDSTRKKILAVEEFTRKLGLDNVQTLWGRAEPTDPRDSGGGAYDAIVSRATAYLPHLIEWSAPFLTPKGIAYYYKLYDKAEIADGKKTMNKYGLTLKHIHTYALAGQERVILCIGAKE